MANRKRGSGYLFRRDGCQTWTLQYYQDGRRVRERSGTKDKAAAQRMLTRRLYQINQGEQVEPEGKPVRLQQLWDAMVLQARNDKRTRAVRDYGTRWLHLGPVFGNLLVKRITSGLVAQYQQQRLAAGAANATVNREVGALKHCLNLAVWDMPTLRVPKMRMLSEADNVRLGFVEDEQYVQLAAHATELWLRTFLELGFTYGFRHSELLGLQVRQVDLKRNTLTLDPGSTKNKEGRAVVMTSKVRQLVDECVRDRQPAHYLLHRGQGQAIRDLRWAWRMLCCRAGLGTLTCTACKGTTTVMVNRCSACGSRKRPKYTGLIVHDLRRSAAKALRLAGVPETTVMKMGGWKTRSMFQRYAIDSHKDQRQAVELLEAARAKASLTPVLAPIDQKPSAAVVQPHAGKVQ